MSRPKPLWVVGLAVVGIMVLSISTRPRVNAQQVSSHIAASVVGGAFGGQPDEEQTAPKVYLPARAMTIPEAKTRMKLQAKIAMNFPNETPLTEVKKYIEESTIDKTDYPDGIPIYFDPQGLQDADKTMESTIRIDLKNLPLETTLSLLLKQLGLSFWINKDGLLIITSASSDDLLITPDQLDHEILSNLSQLRSEVRALRSELQSARRPSFPDDHSAVLPPPSAPAGGTGSKGGMM